MSFSKKDRNLRAGKGTSRAEVSPDRSSFAEDIAAALARDFGHAPSRMKTVARLAGANERTVKNWFQARNGPSGEGLVALMQHSDEVLGVVLRRAGREEMLVAAEIVIARSRLRESLSEIDRLLADTDREQPGGRA